MALTIMVRPPLLDDDFGLRECVEEFVVEQPTPEADGEAFAVSVLPADPLVI